MNITKFEDHVIAESNGAFTIHDAHANGITLAGIRTQIRRRRWNRLGARGWYTTTAAPDRALARLTAAVNATEGLAWGASALWLYGLTPHAPEVPTVAVRRSNTVRPHDVVCHWLVDIAHYPVVERTGVRCTTLEYSLAGFAAHCGTDAAFEEVIDAALRDGRTSWQRLEGVLASWSRSGRRGSARISRALLVRASERVVPLSSWSRHVLQDLQKAGLRGFEMEHRVERADGSLVAQVDLALPRYRYAIELDGAAYHLNRQSFEEDRRRDAELALAGWTVRRFTWAQTKRQFPWVLSVVRADLEHRAAARPA